MAEVELHKCWKLIFGSVFLFSENIYSPVPPNQQKFCVNEYCISISSMEIQIKFLLIMKFEVLEVLDL